MLKPGYKQTDLGVLPEDWEVVTLQTATDCLDNFRIPLNESERNKRRGNIPYCGANGIVDYIDDFLLDDDIILMAEDGGYFDQFATRPIAYRMYGKCWVNNHAHILKAKQGYDQGFVYYCLVHKDISGFIANGTRAKLNRSELNKILIPLPPPAEQQAIAETLGAVDALLTAQRELLAKKRDLKQATQQALLSGERRLLGFEGEWRDTTFGEVLTGFSSGATPYRGNKHFYQGNIKWVTSGELNYNIITETIEHVSPEAVRKTNLKVLPKGTFLMAITGLEAAGTRGSCAILGTEATTNQSCMALYPTKEITTGYLYHYYVLHGDALAFQYCQGSKQQSYTGEIVKRLPILLPPIAEQRAIAAILSDMDAELEALAAQLAKTQALKQGLMQDLLTGRLRLGQGGAVPHAPLSV